MCVRARVCVHVCECVCVCACVCAFVANLEHNIFIQSCEICI